MAWGQTNGAVSGSWATTNWWNAGDWTNGSYPSTNMTLAANANYYYTFGATNSTINVTASGYQYLITGEVTVQPTDPTGRVTLTDSATFTVYRPSSCTNETLTVAYTLGGTATNGTHYTTSPAASGTNGTLTIAAGQTNAVLTVNPYFQKAGEQTVVLSLVSSNYAIGSANAATCTLAAVTALPFAAVGGTVTNYIENGTNFTAHIFTSSGVFTNLVVTNIEVLVVAGGGGGGGKYHAGGGGAGGLIYSNAYPVVGNSNYTVTVGIGGAGGWGEKIRGFNGSNSAFGAIEATGGGGGGRGVWPVAAIRPARTADRAAGLRDIAPPCMGPIFPRARGTEVASAAYMAAGVVAAQVPSG